MDIKLKDYKEKVVAYYDDEGQPYFIKTNDIETLKKISAEGKTIYAVKKEPVLPDEFDEYVKDYIENFATANGYEGIEERLEFDSEAFGKVRTAVKEYVKSLGEYNNSYEILDEVKTIKVIVVDIDLDYDEIDFLKENNIVARKTKGELVKAVSSCSDIDAYEEEIYSRSKSFVDWFLSGQYCYVERNGIHYTTEENDEDMDDDVVKTLIEKVCNYIEENGNQETFEEVINKLKEQLKEE